MAGGSFGPPTRALVAHGPGDLRVDLRPAAAPGPGQVDFDPEAAA